MGNPSTKFGHQSKPEDDHHLEQAVELHRGVWGGNVAGPKDLAVENPISEERIAIPVSIMDSNAGRPPAGDVTPKDESGNANLDVSREGSLYQDPKGTEQETHRTTNRTNPTNRTNKGSH